MLDISDFANLTHLAFDFTQLYIVSYFAGISAVPQIDWMRSLPESELKLLASAEFSNLEVTPDTNSATTALAAPPEQLFYEKFKEKSHPQSLQDQMIYMMKPELRREHQLYISQQATSAGYKTLVPSNLQQASDLAVANLYWYFKARDESEAEAIS